VRAREELAEHEHGEERGGGDAQLVGDDEGLQREQSQGAVGDIVLDGVEKSRGGRR